MNSDVKDGLLGFSDLPTSAEFKSITPRTFKGHVPATRRLENSNDFSTK
ncbi:hypothetical protein IH922_01395 [candidate division KSB1 bacterium]|nr:hypothetical protein [candidate division KSB1 bacterium]